MAEPTQIVETPEVQNENNSENVENVEQNETQIESETLNAVDQAENNDQTEATHDETADETDDADEAADTKPTFEVEDESESDDESEEDVDLSKYTVLDADNLDEDEVIPGQEFALFSFMSPEGIMNCNVRMIKFRGAFPSIEKATEHADTLKKTDKYFKIHCAESGKWVEFDPPEDHVEQVVAGNKKQQKIVDAQRKARMDKANELAGRYKQKIDKSDRGAKDRIEESKKAGAAEDYANKNRSKTQAKKAKKQKKIEANQRSGKSSRGEAMRKRLAKRLAEKKEKEANAANKRRLEETRESGQVNEADLQQKTAAVNQASENLEQQKSELQRTNANIDKIRKMMQNR
jgi:uncharacterized protein DUF5832